MIDCLDEKISDLLSDINSAFDESAIVAVSDADGLIAYVNDKFCQISKYSAEELLGKPHCFISSEFYPKNFFEKLRRTIESGQIWRGEIKNRARDGEVYWVAVTIVPFFNDTGKPVRYIAVQYDITQHKHAAEKLQKQLKKNKIFKDELRTQNEHVLFSREMLTKAFAASPNGLIISDLKDGKIIEINESGANLFGYPRLRMIGQTSLALNLFIDPADRSRALEIIKRENRLKDFETSIRNAGGEQREAVFSSEKLKVGEQECILTVIRDISQQKKVEKKLRESEQQMRLVLNASKIGIWLYDIVSDQVTWSPENCRLFGVEYFDGKSETFWELVDERDRQRVYKAFHSAVANKTFYDTEYRVIKPDGAARWFKGRGHCEYDASGKPIRFLGANLDITKRKLADEKLRESEERLQIAVEVADFAVCEFDYLDDSVRLSKEAAKLFDFGTDETIIPRDALHARFHPEDAETIKNLIYRALDPDGDGWLACEHRIIRRDGDVCWLNVRKKVFFDNTIDPPRPEKAILAAQEITERKRREENLAFLSEVLSLFEKQSDIGNIMRTICEKAVNFLNVANCFFADIDEPLNTATINYTWSSPGTTVPRGVCCLSNLTDRNFRLAVNAGKTVIIGGLQISACTDTGNYADFPVVASVAAPFKIKGIWKSLFVVSDNAARRWRDDETELIEEISARVSSRLERARAEYALRESEERLRAFVTASSDAIFSMNPDWSKMLFLNGKEFLSETLQPSRNWLEKYVPSEDQPLFLEAVGKALETKKIFEIEHRVFKADGEIGWAHSRAIPLFDELDKVTAWFGAARDITERRRAEQLITEKNQLLEQSYDAIFIWNIDEGIIYWHQNTEQLYGFTESEAFNRQAKDLLKTVYPTPYPEFIAQLRKQGYWEGELIHTTKAGAEVIVEARLHVIRHDAENLIVLETLRDITERRRIEAQLVRAAQLALVGELAAGLAHEIKNPLAGIKGVIDILIQRRESTAADEREILESVRYEVERIDKTVRALLRHARPRSLEPRFASLAETVRRAAQIALYRSSVQNSPVEKLPIELDLPDAPCLILHDEAAVEDAVLNLILNAGDAIANKKNGKIKISLSAAKLPGDEFLIEVADNGIGIDAEKLETIFTPFQTTKTEGTGLGLALVKRVVRAHGGECEVRSIPDRGSSFLIRLPFGGAGNQRFDAPQANQSL